MVHLAPNRARLVPARAASFPNSAPGGFFGVAPAPAASGDLFGAAPAPAASGDLFGAAPAPAASGGLPEP